jgi:hypothetical protein
MACCISPRSLALGAAALLASMLAPSLVAAQPARARPAATAVARSAVARIADALATELAPLGAHGLVVAAPLALAEPSPRARELAVLVAAQLAGRLGRATQAHREPLALDAARAAARGVDALVFVSARLADGRLRVTADLFPVARTVWARIRNPEPGPVAHAFAEAAIDAEIRSYLTPIPLTAAVVTRAKNFEADVVALACGDLDGDGSLEIVSVSRRRISTVRLRAGRVEILASKSWAELAGVHPTPLREPLGFATLIGADAASFVDVGLTDRDHSVRLDGRLGVAAPLEGLALPNAGGTACARGRGLGMAPLARCAPGDDAPAPSGLMGPRDALASAALVAANGAPLAVWAARRADGVVELIDGAGSTALASGVGAQLAVGDLDQDGEPELVASLDVDDPRLDAVVVRSWQRAAGPGTLTERLRLPAAAGVRALGVCPADGLGRAPFVVATADELWVVR